MATEPQVNIARWQRILEVAVLALTALSSFLAARQIPTPPPQSTPVPPIISPSPKVPDGKIAPPNDGPNEMIDPEKAIVKWGMGKAGCTATVLYPYNEKEGYYWVLCAAHCSGYRAGGTATVMTHNGRKYKATVRAVKNDADLMLMQLTTKDRLYMAKVYQGRVSEGVKIWHKGFGVVTPGKKEWGVTSRTRYRDTYINTDIHMSSGDSGAGVFRADTGELVAVVSRTTSVGNASGSAEFVEGMKDAVNAVDGSCAPGT